MARLPRLKGKEIVKALTRAGFAILRTKGSHNFMRHPDGRATVVPVHGSEIIGAGLLSKILRDCELTREQLAEFL